MIQYDGVSAVYLYSHWGGTELPSIVQLALNKKWRWNDGAYLTRIIFDEMTAGSHGNETGFGISTGLCDNEHKIIVVNPGKQTVGFADEENPLTVVGKTWTFEEFATLDSETLEKASK